jgi:Fe-S oxidoreductase
MSLESLIFLVVAGGAFGYSGYRFSILYKMMRAHQGKVPTLSDLPRRFQEILVNVIGQKAVLQKQPIGIAHMMIFWGFIVISLGTLEQFLSTLVPGASYEFVGQPLYQIFHFSQDFFCTLVLIGLGYAGYRRWVIQPPGVGKSSDANMVLIFTASLMISILLMNAFHILGDNPWYQTSLPVSAYLASFLGNIQLDTETQSQIGHAFKWLHMLLVLGFSMYIPNSKHLHIVAAGPNTFLRKLEREKGMKPIRFEDETITQYGAAKVTDLSWKDVLDYYSCTECGRCQDLCPAHNTGKPLSPKRLIIDLKYNMYRNKDAILAGNYEAVTPAIDDAVTEDVIWACTSCRACEIACPVFIEHTDKIYDIRRNLVMMESKFPAEVQAVFKNLETNASPWAFSSSDRGNWAEGLDVPVMANVGEKQPEVLLWVGCAGSFDDRNKKVLRSFVNLLKKADISFAILGTEEQCTGDAARRIGNEYLFQTLAQANIETLNRYQVKKIVTACPHCFNTLKNEYKDFGGSYEVYHHSSFLTELVTNGRLKPAKAISEKITFHDSCYLGRWNSIYAEPRNVLAAIPGTEVLEMKSHHDQSMCCGAGGGRMWMEETIGKRVNITRTEQALETGATIIASSCPFCMTMLTDGTKAKEKQDQVKVLDIAELMDQSMSS